MVEAIFGLLGVIVGSFLTIVKDWWSEKERTKKDANFLAIQVSCILDRYVNACCGVASDNGLYRGEYGQDGYACVQTDLPKLNVEQLKVEWRSIPPSLSYRILSFGNEIEVANARIEHASAEAYPPDFEDFFEERQYQYASLGIKAANLAADLRKHVGLPEKEVLSWDPLDYMVEKWQELENARARRMQAFPLTDDTKST